MADPWYAEMARRAAERAETEAERTHGIPEPVPAPDDGTCRQCFEWRYWPKGDRHFGQAWWRICSQTCAHPHHDDDGPAFAAAPKRVTGVTITLSTSTETISSGDASKFMGSALLEQVAHAP